MSNIIRFSDARRTSRANLHLGWLAGSTLNLYTTPVPADADTAITTQTLLATFILPDPAGTVTDGVLTVASIDPATNVADGTVAWARAFDDADTVIADYDVGAVGSGAAIEMTPITVVSGSNSTISSFVIIEG